MSVRTDERPSVLLATDGSPAALWAEVWIKGLSWSTAPVVEVLSVADSAVTLPGWLREPDDTHVGLMLESLREDQMAEASSIGEICAARLRDSGFHCVTTSGFGEPAVKLLARIKDMHPDLVAMGCRGRSDVEAMLLGSVTQQVAQHTTAPTLIARRTGMSPGPLPQRIVVVVDPDTEARSVIDWLSQHGWLRESRVTLLGLLGSMTGPATNDRDPAGRIVTLAHARARRTLERVARDVESRATHVSVEVRHGHRLRACREVAEHTRADLVALTLTRSEPGRYPLEEKLTRYLSTSVLLVPSR